MTMILENFWRRLTGRGLRMSFPMIAPQPESLRAWRRLLNAPKAKG